MSLSWLERKPNTGLLQAWRAGAGKVATAPAPFGVRTPENSVCAPFWRWVAQHRGRMDGERSVQIFWFFSCFTTSVTRWGAYRPLPSENFTHWLQGLVSYPVRAAGEIGNPLTANEIAYISVTWHETCI